MITTCRFLSARLASVAAVRARGDRGEGVISAAIAVLIMAFLGVAMWIGLRQIWDTAESNTSDQVEQIGQ